MIQFRPAPHCLHTLKRHLLPSLIKRMHRRSILERRRRLWDTMHRLHPIVFNEKRFTGLRRRLEENGIGRVERDVVVKVVEWCQEEAVGWIQVQTRSKKKKSVEVLL